MSVLKPGIGVMGGSQAAEVLTTVKQAPLRSVADVAGACEAKTQWQGTESGSSLLLALLLA